MPKKTVIIGIGNFIMKDEGGGIHAVKKLFEMALPQDVEVMDGGTDAMELLSLFQEFERIIVIDAIKAGGEQGTIYRVTPEDIMEDSKRPLSLHKMGLLDVLLMARQLGEHGNVVIIGVEPKEISCSIDLTPEVEATHPDVMHAVLTEIN